MLLYFKQLLLVVIRLLMYWSLLSETFRYSTNSLLANSLRAFGCGWCSFWAFMAKRILVELNP